MRSKCKRCGSVSELDDKSVMSLVSLERTDLRLRV